MKHKIVDAWPNFTRVCFQFRSAVVFFFFFQSFLRTLRSLKYSSTAAGGLNKV